MPIHRAVQWLSVYGRRYPQAWDLFAKLQKDRPEPWPEWCWCPLAGAHGVIARHHEIWQTEPLPDTAALGAIAAWRATQGIYRFDRTLLDELLESDIPGNVPVNALERMPAWCVYIETPDLTFAKFQVHGFYAHLEWDFDRKQMELRFAIDATNAEEPDFESLVTCMVDLGGTFEEGFASARRRSQEHSLSWYRQGVEQEAKRENKTLTPEEVEARATYLWEVEGAHLEFLLKQLTSLLLYLCADEADVPRPEKLPVRWVYTKKKHLILPSAQGQTIYPCGTVIGAKLRQARKDFDEHIRYLNSTGRKQRPHWRQGHYKPYWIGKRTEPQTQIVHWIPAGPVGFKSRDMTVPEVATIRPVKDGE